MHMGSNLPYALERQLYQMRQTNIKCKALADKVANLRKRAGHGWWRELLIDEQGRVFRSQMRRVTPR